MTNAEQWLADLEDKAKAAIDTAGWGDMDWSGAHEDFFYAANPATVLRLVGIVRWLADNIPGVVRPCAGCSRKCFLGDITKCEGDSGAECWIAAAYIATEDHHDQLP